jgi:hypothetical protein
MLGLRRRAPPSKDAASAPPRATRPRPAEGGGVRHEGFTCHGCGVTPIVGTRLRAAPRADGRAGAHNSVRSINFCRPCLDGPLGHSYTASFGPFSEVQHLPPSGQLYEEKGHSCNPGGELFHKLTACGGEELLQQVLQQLGVRDLGRLELTCHFFRANTMLMRDGLRCECAAAARAAAAAAAAAVAVAVAVAFLRRDGPPSVWVLADTAVAALNQRGEPSRPQRGAAPRLPTHGRRARPGALMDAAALAHVPQPHARAVWALPPPSRRRRRHLCCRHRRRRRRR